MKLLAAQPGALFIGQGVAYSGVATYPDFEGIPLSQRIEFPICEEMNLGAALGMAMDGHTLPVVCLPRVDFLLRAADALVNHLDKLEEMSCGQWVPKVIIRCRVGSRAPLDPGPQHRQNHAAALRLMLTTVCVREIREDADILPTYERAVASPRSSLVIEAL